MARDDRAERVLGAHPDADARAAPDGRGRRREVALGSARRGAPQRRPRRDLARDRRSSRAAAGRAAPARVRRPLVRRARRGARGLRAPPSSRCSSGRGRACVARSRRLRRTRGRVLARVPRAARRRHRRRFGAGRGEGRRGRRRGGGRDERRGRRAPHARAPPLGATVPRPVTVHHRVERSPPVPRAASSASMPHAHARAAQRQPSCTDDRGSSGRAGRADAMVSDRRRDGRSRTARTDTGGPSGTRPRPWRTRAPGARTTAARLDERRTRPGGAARLVAQPTLLGRGRLLIGSEHSSGTVRPGGSTSGRGSRRPRIRSSRSPSRRRTTPPEQACTGPGDARLDR